MKASCDEGYILGESELPLPPKGEASLRDTNKSEKGGRNAVGTM